MNWHELPFSKQMSLVLTAHNEPSFFVESPYFLGEKLFPVQKQILEDFYKGKYTQLVVIAGMRSGKTRLGIFMLLYELFKLLCLDDPVKQYRLAKGEKIYLLAVSYKEDQAYDTILTPLKGELDGSPFFQQFRYRLVENEIRFDNFTVRVFGANSLGNVGRTAKAVMFDELARYKTTTGRTSGRVVYQTLSRSTETFGREGFKFVFSAPLTQVDFSMQLFRQADQYTLAYKIPTWQFNPNISLQSLKSEFERDFLAAQRDFGAEPPVGASPFFADQSVLKLTDRSNMLAAIYEDVSISPLPHDYVLAGDPSVRNNAFGFALTHEEDGRIIADGLFRYLPTKRLEVDPVEIENFIMRIVDKVPVRTVVFDTWHYPTILSKLAARGVEIISHIVRKPDYDLLKAKLYENKLEICNFPDVIDELKSLEVSGSKITTNYSKDVSDALANAIYVHETFKVKKAVPFNLARRV